MQDVAYSVVDIVDFIAAGVDDLCELAEVVVEILKCHIALGVCILNTCDHADHYAEP